MDRRLKAKREKAGVIGILTGILLVIYVIGLLLPMLWSLVTSFTEVNSYFDFYVDKVFTNGPAFKLTADNSEESIAEIISDGCDMGVKSLKGYLEQYKGAEVPARALCRTLVAVEQQLGTEIRQFL